ncbi:MAG: methyltransferase [Betaproteobacteria bacterium]|nr:MAG: methyltransferase [Betaproteobacteria bacterium]
MKTEYEQQLDRIRAANDAEWLHILAHGRDAYSLLPVLPDEMTQRRFVGKANEAAFSVAIETFKVAVAEATKLGFRLVPESRLMDFGCGWGRFSQVAFKYFDPANIVSADVQDSALDICRETGLRTNLLLVPMHPPSSLPNDSINFIIAYSVFSHLDEQIHLAWLREFKRILAPGGVVAVTTRPRGFINYVNSLSNASEIPPHARGLVNLFQNPGEALEAYDRGEFVYGEFPSPGRIGKGYGEACIPQKYVMDHWGDMFHQLAWVDANSHIDQALIVARKGSD